MVSPAAGKVVLIRFPFSDLSQTKLRPAVVLADAGRNDWVLCQITSKPYEDLRSISPTNENFGEGSLRVASFARPGKLFTANSSLLLNEVGLLKPEIMEQIITSVIEILRPKVKVEDVSGENETTA